MSGTESGELPVAETDTRWRANDIRVACMQEFSSERLWLFVTKNTETMKHEVLAANEHCRKLDDATLERVRAFCAAMSGRLSEGASGAVADEVTGDDVVSVSHATASR